MKRVWQKSLAIGLLIIIVEQWLRLSWFRWPDTIRDFGRELYTPWQINQGRELYRDLFHLYGPFSDYLNALIFHCFGTSLTNLVIANFILLSLLATLIFLLFRYLAGFWTALFSVFILLGIFAFGQYADVGNYNYICPYAHEVVHGLILSFLAFYFLKQWILQPSAFLLVILGCLWGLVFLTKFEIFFALSCALCVFFVGHCWLEKDGLLDFRRWGRRSAIAAILVLAFCAALIYFTRGNFWESIVRRYVDLLVHPQIHGYYGNVSGLDHPQANLALVIKSALGCCLAIGILFLLSRRISKIKQKSIRAIGLGIAIMLIVGGGFLLTTHMLWLLFRPLPVILAVMAVLLIIKLYKRTLDRNEAMKLLLLLTVTIFSLALLLKIILNVHVYHYGFALTMPGALLLGMVFVYYLPLWGRGRWFRPYIFRSLVFAILVALIIGHFKWSQYYYQRQDYRVGMGKDALWAWNPHVYATPNLVDDATKWIEANSKPTDTLVVLPEGAMANYLSRRANPTPTIEFMPGMDEAKIIHSFESTAPDFMMVVFRDMSEYGAAFFGKDYGLKVNQWIREHYTLVFYMQAPNQEGLEFVTVFKRGKLKVSYQSTDLILR